MGSLSSLYNELSRYNNLLGSVNSIIGYTNNSIDALNIAADKIGEHYNIDDSRADSKQISICRDDLISQKEYLLKKTIPAINNEIARIKREIEILESENDG